MLAGFRAQNHPQQTDARGALDEVDDRGTHPDYFEPWNERFGGFTLDAAAAPHNAKCERFYTRADDGLAQSWAGERVWCNPPYSGLYSWVEKAWTEWPHTKGIVMLLPANRVEQKWWQELVEPQRDRPGSPLTVEFLPGRMRFIRPNAKVDPRGDRPPFGCALLIWADPKEDEPWSLANERGPTVAELAWGDKRLIDSVVAEALMEVVAALNEQLGHSAEMEMAVRSLETRARFLRGEIEKPYLWRKRD